jgi:UDP-2,4-diacetamido-2,4,6-trideoxy-beta-L-altropyranose hydrolase
MKAVFRADASLQMGAGHVMRCLTLAEALRATGAQCHFISRAHPGHLLELIRERGFAASVLPAESSQAPANTQVASDRPEELVHAAWLGCDWQTDAQQTSAVLVQLQPDWLVVDHYALDQRWETALRPHYQKLMVIDDLADRPHQCELLLDQNLGRQQQDYADLVPAQCKLLTGPQFALLRPEFAALRAYSMRRRQQPILKQVLITMGGVDQPNATSRVMQALKSCALPQDCRISVIMGLQAPWLQQVRALAQDMPWSTEVLVNISDMAQRMADSDLAIGAAGSTSWERCCLGLPTLMVVLADNQKEGATALADSECALLLGEVENIKKSLQPMMHLLQKIEMLQALSQASYAATDGQGTKKITTLLKALLKIEVETELRARLAEVSDEQLLFDWANDPITRNNAFNPAPIQLKVHRAWLTQCLSDPANCAIFIVENDEGVPLGQVRFNKVESLCWKIDYSLAPHFRGVGFGKNLLTTAIDAFQQSYSGDALLGIVKMGNIPSCRVFESLDFSGTREEPAGVMTYRRTLAKVI